MATPFSRMINSVKRLEKTYDKNTVSAEGQKKAAETYANLWNEARLDLRKASIAINRLEQEIGFCHSIITNGCQTPEQTAYVFDIPPVQERLDE